MNKTCIPTCHAFIAVQARPAPGRRPSQSRLSRLSRRLCHLLLAAACLPPAMAADNVDLVVSGRIVPTPCTVNLANNGSADFGNITAAELPAPGTRLLSAERTLPFSIQCVPANSPRLSFKDDRANSVPAIYDTLSTASGRAGMFGLGRVADKNIGMYLLHFRDLKADGKDAKLVGSRDGEAPWKFIGPAEVITKEFKYVWSTTAEPQTGTFGAINGDLVVQLWPEPLDELPLQSEIRLDGSTTLVLEYP
ncbi:DUF1120 domain-containing protein [Herbaspirillum sp. YR522]|uniref:DUF1120 domain-containing protein n=1 Tax=Herbaspirillum sp. YR522 TaxID=1144342 RepID=UPI00026F5371|nr:DUF1120 domain-containing protein [Herbaspirillum sp. YR522]EJN08432.1 P pilus assembly protein, pilin FimA [Herbaspirillum sp. YR522]